MLTKIKRESPIFYTKSTDSIIKAFCPKCGEELEPSDIEMFYACPFCNCPLENSEKLEEFLLQPAVRSWISRTNQSLM